MWQPDAASKSAAIRVVPRTLETWLGVRRAQLLSCLLLAAHISTLKPSSTGPTVSCAANQVPAVVKACSQPNVCKRNVWPGHLFPDTCLSWLHLHAHRTRGVSGLGSRGHQYRTICDMHTPLRTHSMLVSQTWAKCALIRPL